MQKSRLNKQKLYPYYLRKGGEKEKEVDNKNRIKMKIHPIKL